jgi:CDGSH-type Zn-finger protein
MAEDQREKPVTDDANAGGEVVIKARKNGPYVVEGPVRIVDSEGNEWSTVGKKRISLCRCGASLTKPFCDGTHSKMGFQAAESAVREAEGESQTATQAD